MKSITCCFTGHREIDKSKSETIKVVLREKTLELIDKGYRIFMAGGAKGFDILAEQSVLALKPEYPCIQLHLVLPYLEQAKSWSERDKATYDFIKSKADKITYTQQEYSKGCMFKRNRYLIDNSSACICYLNRNSGGTHYTVKYALRHNVGVVNMFSYGIKLDVAK